MKFVVLVVGLLLSHVGARADEPKPPYHDVRLSGVGGGSVYLDGGRDKPHTPTLHNVGLQAAGGLQLHALHVGPTEMYSIEGVATLQLGALDGKADLSLHSGATAMAGAHAGPAFIMGGATLTLDASLTRSNAANREISAAVPIFAGMTFEGERGVRVLLGPVVQYKLGETAYGSSDALEAGGRIVIAKKDEGSLMGQIITTAVGKENRGSTIEWSVIGQYRVWRELFLGAQVSVGTMSDRANKDGSRPSRANDTEVSNVKALLTAAKAF